MKRFMRRFAECSAGATSIEYALIAVLIAVVIIASLTNVGTELADIFNNVANGFPES